MRSREVLLLCLLGMIFVLTTGPVWAAPKVEILSAETTSPTGVSDSDFRLDEPGVLRITFALTGTSQKVQVKGIVRFRDDPCKEKYKGRLAVRGAGIYTMEIEVDSWPACATLLESHPLKYILKVRYHKQSDLFTGKWTSKDRDFSFVTFYPPLGDVPPHAEFTISNDSEQTGPAPLIVDFLDQSTGSVTAWSWDVDDDGFEDYNTQNPQHFYNAAGAYSVKLTVTGPAGTDTIKKKNFIVAE